MPKPDAKASPIRSDFADDADMAELIAMFVGEMPNRISAITECYEEQRLTELQTLAHQLKGSGSGYGFEPVSQIAAQLESALKSHVELEAMRNEVESLIDICGRLSC